MDASRWSSSGGGFWRRRDGVFRPEPDRAAAVVAALNAPEFAVGGRWRLDGASPPPRVFEPAGRRPLRAVARKYPIPAEVGEIVAKAVTNAVKHSDASVTAVVVVVVEVLAERRAIGIRDLAKLGASIPGGW